ncbi:MAG TPA: (2Fe-2S)-binding protein [Mycobacteriales bacterium]|jgi:bacterioferritin-associated ferredoxin|nr:(2Fe-2S)-binding protein [Mycobacteriales bacterium]
MYACICFAVSEDELDDAISAGARTEEEVGDACGAGTGCGSCLDRICARLMASAPQARQDAATHRPPRGIVPTDRRCRAG